MPSLSEIARDERTARMALSMLVEPDDAVTGHLLATVGGTHASLQATTAQALAELGAETRRLHSGLAERVEAQLDGLSGRFGSAVTTVADGWTAAEELLGNYPESAATLRPYECVVLKK